MDEDLWGLDRLFDVAYAKGVPPKWLLRLWPSQVLYLIHNER